MTARSAAHVYVTSKDGTRRAWLRPGDEVPSWAQLDERNVQGASSTGIEDSPSPETSGEVPEPARSGRGSGADAWRAFAESKGVTVDSGMTRDEIIAACEQASVVSPEG
ncbi:hypothetical protein [Streptomyces sp. NPDC101166]|uniref:hypothetical protein n=1 Tax=Streptomyces sp. NPDC101166 TaxID=3366120 RepID=UPI0038213FDE